MATETVADPEIEKPGGVEGHGRQQIGSGQASVKMYNRRLASLIHAGRIEPSRIVSHELSLDEAADAYKHFGDRDQGWTKVLFKPAA